MVINQTKESFINPAARILGFNINGYRTLIVYADLNGLVYESMQIATPIDKPFLSGYDEILNAADKLLARTQAQHLPNPQVISLAISGDLDVERGVLVAAPDMPEWQSVPVKGRLSMRYNLPVFIEQEANAGALAEFYFGAGQGHRNIVFISMEPSIRTGILSDGVIYRSPGGYAGNLGEVSMADYGPAGYGLPGSLNGFASSPGIVELAHMRFPHTWRADLSVNQLVELAQNGDLDSQKIFAEAGDWLGKALSPLVRLLHPEVMILGKPGCLLDTILLNPARLALQSSTNLPAERMPQLLPAKLCVRLAEITALAPVIDRFRQQR
jgi:glucokinase